MPTEERAAVCIQSHFRGFSWRRMQRRGIRAVTKLQALQRGRFTRREFAQLRDFSREQESYQQATRRRQIRIWRNEQELYFLQHTNAADLERVHAFQQHRSARVIQRSWRSANTSTAVSTSEQEVIADPCDRIYTFDPFALKTADSKARFNHWERDGRSSITSQLASSFFLNKDDLHHASVRQLPASIADEEAFATRRKTIQERVKRLVAQDKAKTEPLSKSSAPTSSPAKGSKPSMNRRRELYEQLVAMQRSTAQRLSHYQRKIRALRPENEILTAQLIMSCKNRLKYLQSDSPEQLTPLTEDNQQSYDQANKLMEEWDSVRQVQAWNHHRRAVRSVLDKRDWWQTQLAGEERDIRRVVMVKSPWENENRIWVWPRSENSNQKHAEGDSNAKTDTTADHPVSSSWPSEEIHRFLASEKRAQSLDNDPVDDHEASEWWRAHCTQSHLAINGGLVVEHPYSAEFTSNVNNDGDTFPVCTSEMVANRDLYELQQQAKRAACTKSLTRDIEQRMRTLAAHVERRVHDMEAQVEANTQLALELVQRKEEQRVRITREQQAIVTIQRRARGMQGRRVARERRAEFFVMVRGRAIRRGRCEECGDERAVLECQQCEESLHFCPICWVHVHSTRRRKTHVAIPMTTVVPAPMRENAVSAKASAVTAPNAVLDITNTKSVEVETGPKLRRLPSPKNLTPRLTKSAAGDVRNSELDIKKPDETKTKQDDIRTVTTPRSVDVEAISELAEACALARRVRSEAAEVPAADRGATLSAWDQQQTEEGTEIRDESSENEEQFAAVTGDGAVMDNAGAEEQEDLGETMKIVSMPRVDSAQLSVAALPTHDPEERPKPDDVLSLDASVAASTPACVLRDEMTHRIIEHEAIEDAEGEGGSSNNGINDTDACA